MAALLMTPLAHRLANQLTLPIKERQLFWQGNAHILKDYLDDTHFFEVTEIIPLRPTFAGLSEEFVSQRVFLPADKTWLEWKSGDSRIGLLLEKYSQTAATVTAIWDNIANEIGQISLISDDYRTNGGGACPNEWMQPNLPEKLISMAHFLLVVINSPKIIGRKQHMPHRGLERKLLARKSLSGKYPLHAWHELKLLAQPTYVDESGATIEAHLTGSKCLHFCRSHLRVRNGRLELVSAHWRGDPALGIKRTRYLVTA